MASLNKVQLIGNLGDDPETRYTQGGTAITTIRMATTRTWKNDAGQKQEKTEWHRVKLWGKLGEIAGEYLRKGASVYIEGRIEYGEYTGQDGNKRYTTDIIAEEMKMLGGRRDGDDRGEARPTRNAERAQSARDQRQAGAQQAAPKPDFAEDFSDDDIPF